MSIEESHPIHPVYIETHAKLKEYIEIGRRVFHTTFANSLSSTTVVGISIFFFLFWQRLNTAALFFRHSFFCVNNFLYWRRIFAFLQCWLHTRFSIKISVELSDKHIFIGVIRIAPSSEITLSNWQSRQRWKEKRYISSGLSRPLFRYIDDVV